MQSTFRSLLFVAMFLAVVPNIGRAESNVQIPPSSIVRANLVNAIDAKKNNAGDEVSAKVTSDLKVDGTVLIRRNSIIVGHLTDVRARSQSQDISVIAISFERVTLKDGGEIPVTVVVQGLQKPPDDPNGNMNEILRGAGASQTAAGETAKAGAMGGIGANRQILTASTQGVLGYPGIGLQQSTVYSPTTNVHLDEGTHMILQVTEKKSPSPAH